MIHRCVDPVALALTAPGAPFEIVAGPDGDAFRDLPRTLTGIYRHGREYGDRRMLQTEHAAYSYTEVFALADRVARALVDRFGIKPGDSVGMAMPAGLEWMASFMAVHAVGATTVMINTRCAPEEMTHAILLTGPTLIFANADRAAALRTEADSANWRLIVSGGREQLRDGQDFDLADILSDGSAEPFEPVERKPGDAAIVMFTSGTTGRPKAVRLDDSAIAHMVGISGMTGAIQDRRYAIEFGHEIPRERASASCATIIVGPVFHTSGITPFMRGLYYGAPLFVFSKWNAEVALDLMEREPVTRLGFVPTMLSDMLASPRVGPQNLGSVMVLSSGAAALDLKLVDRLRAVAPTVMIANSYGQTESAGWISSICGEDYIAHPESIGYVLPTIEVRIVRDDGEDAEPYEHGEIRARGIGIMRGYVGDPQATAETLAGGWLHTGDNGWIDEDGRLFLADRRKNMILSGGENVYCAEVERVLGDHPAVAEVIAYGEPDERFGERVAATVVLRAGEQLDTEDLRLYARTRLAGYKVPREIAVRSTPLPRTPTMKVDRGTFLRELESKA
ncbi:class I adenylate-forming enzyme family protein [soil metagenome]